MSDFNKEKKNKLLFWMPFILLFLISALLFIYFKNTIIGWGLLIVFFVIIFLFKKFLSRLGAKAVIGWIIILAVILIIFTFTVQGNIDNSSQAGSKSSSLSNNTNSSQEAKSSTSSDNTNSSTEAKSSTINTLQFSNSYDFPNNKGTYVINVNTDAKNNYILTITVKMPKEAIPDGFKWNTNMITETITVGTTKIIADDHIAVYWQSLNSKPDYDHTTFFSTEVNAGKFSTDPSYLAGFKDATFTKSAKSINELKNYMQSGDKLDIYWYNVKEVGAQADDSTSNSIRILYEKGYGLHPNIAEATIPWSDIILKLGI